MPLLNQTELELWWITQTGTYRDSSRDSIFQNRPDKLNVVGLVEHTEIIVGEEIAHNSEVYSEVVQNRARTMDWFAGG